MVPFPARRADDPEPLRAPAPSPKPIEPQIEELASRLAAQGFQSTELVLDLLLHDLADEARQALDASGAAIALERGGELVCRAAAGSTAPDLGVRVQSESGLSGSCVKQGTTQVCDDTEADSRVDTEACRALGVRSIAVTPLFSADHIIGVFEAFSTRPQAFSPEHVSKLESLARAATQTVKATREKVTAPQEGAGSATEEAIADKSSALSVASVMQRVGPVDPAVRILRWLVIGFAIPLVVLVGFDLGWHRAHAPARALNRPSDEHAGQPAPANESLPPPAVEKTPTANPTVTNPKSATAKAKPPDEPVSQGGLVVYQNGKVIYREAPPAKGQKRVSPPPSARQDNAGAASSTLKTNGARQTDKPAENSSESAGASLPPGITGGRLLHSVKPQYPREAVVNKLEGPVVLHGTVGEDGTIRDLKVVQGDPILSEAALQAVQQWLYEPYRRNDTPISMPIDITIDFNLPK